MQVDSVACVGLHAQLAATAGRLQGHFSFFPFLCASYPWFWVAYQQRLVGCSGVMADLLGRTSDVLALSIGMQLPQWQGMSSVFHDIVVQCAHNESACAFL